MVLEVVLLAMEAAVVVVKELQVGMEDPVMLLETVVLEQQVH